MKNRLRILCWTAALLAVGGVAYAQSQACQQAQAAYNARVADHNARCSNVQAGSAQAAQCAAEAQQLQSARPNCQ